MRRFSERVVPIIKHLQYEKFSDQIRLQASDRRLLTLKRLADGVRTSRYDLPVDRLAASSFKRLDIPKSESVNHGCESNVRVRFNRPDRLACSSELRRPMMFAFTP